MKNVKETLEEAANKYASTTKPENDFEQGLCAGKALGFIKGAQWQAERMYSEEDMIEFSKFCQTGEFELRSVNKSLLEEFEQFKKR